MSREQLGRILSRANPNTIQDKFLVGYQGWFTAADMEDDNLRWLHWFNGERVNIDIWPDVSEYSPSELYAAPGLTKKSGEQCFLFSSRNRKTVQRHFHWMANHGVDGAFLQRFAGQCDLEQPGNEGIFRLRDEVLDRCQESAEKEGRVFAIMYDVSGVAPDRIQGIIERDWRHLVHQKAVLDSPNYLREHGKAVVALWGFGFAERNHSPAVVRAITEYLRTFTPGGVYVMAGVPAHWRTSTQDADPNPDFGDVWLKSFDAISPWTVGRYSNEDEADRFAEESIKYDTELIKRVNESSTRRVDYIPVIFPGGSGFNVSEGAWGFNNIKRNGGHFLWRQVFNAQRNGARIIYGAMWDEYDEGTAFMPVVSYKTQLPVSDNKFLALDADGHDLPPDWYMRICGLVGEGLRGERMIRELFPHKELQDYWSTRSRYKKSKLDTVSGDNSKQASSPGHPGHSFVVVNPDERPPPPYAIEGEPLSSDPIPIRPSPATYSSDIPAIISMSTHARTPSISLSEHLDTSEPNYMISNLTSDVNRQSSPFASGPPSPLTSRSTTPLYPPPLTNSFPSHSYYPQSHITESTMPMPMPFVPLVPVGNSPGQSAPDSDPYSAWGNQDEQYRAQYEPSYLPSPYPPPLRPRLNVSASPGGLNTYNTSINTQQAHSSASANVSPQVSIAYSRSSENIPSSQASGHAGSHTVYLQGSRYPPNPQHPSYGQNLPHHERHSPTSPSHFPSSHYASHSPSPEQSTHHSVRPATLPQPPPPPPRINLAHHEHSASHSPTPPSHSPSPHPPPPEQSMYHSVRPPPPPPPPHHVATLPKHEPKLSHSGSTSSKITEGALSLAKSGMDMLIGKDRKKTGQTSAQGSSKK